MDILQAKFAYRKFHEVMLEGGALAEMGLLIDRHRL